MKARSRPGAKRARKKIRRSLTLAGRPGDCFEDCAGDPAPAPVGMKAEVAKAAGERKNILR